MKKITFLIIFSISLNLSFSQGTDILGAEQFCSGNSQLTFNNVYGGSDFTPVGCLGSIPNASYFYMVIDQPGDLYFNINQEDLFGAPIDVDFIAWGPFIDLNDANTSITYTDCPTCPNNAGNPTFYPYAPDYITDCSYDAAPTETMTILNALPGQIYVVLITNFDSDEGIINFQQVGGLGTTTCSILPVCGNKYFDVGGPTGNHAGYETTTITPYFAGGTVTVDFTLVDIPDPGDVLTVYNGPNNTFPVLGIVTGLPAIFTSTTAANPTGAITFELISNNDTNVGTGWEADITCTPPPPPPTCGETFYDSGGSGGNYVANEAQVINVFADTAGDIVTVTFTAFNTENGADVLTVYDGPNITYPVLGIFSGTTIPGPFTSSDLSGALTFVFTSNATIESSGWTADITCVTPPTCGFTFYDSGGPSGDYLANELQTNTFYPDTPGDLVTATFTAFDIESCCDDLYVYDGPDSTYPLLGVFAGTTIPGPFTSSDASGALTFVFDSDSSVQYSGWVANLTCRTPICGTTVYDSGGLGGDYSANESETTTLYPDIAGDLVNVIFSAFNTQNGIDELSIYDGPDATYPLLGTFSGTTIPGPFTSSDLATGALTFVFTSNSSIQNSGWAADVICLPPPTCGNTFYDSGGAGGNYSAYELQTTTFFPDTPGDVVTATFTAFYTEGCCDDLYVYDGPDSTYPLLGVFAGTTIPGPFTSTDASGALTFVFDSDSSVQYSGWAADLTCSAPICGTTVYDSGGLGGNYSANESETTTLYPDIAGDLVNVTFTAFNTQNGIDELSIYDGPDATYPLLGTFSGTTIPGPFTSSDLATGAITFVFTSNGTIQNSGWAADVICLPPPTCGTTFYDSGGAGGDYSAYEFQTTTFFPDTPVDVVTVTFTAFDLETCCDELLVYDGPDATYPLLGTFAGNTIPGPFTSSDASGALTFVFDSDSSVQYDGWAADVTCASNCNLSITDTIYPIGADECTLDYTELVATTGNPSLNRIDIFSENFNGAGMPTGWTIFNATPNTIWTIANSNQAGGTANEVVLDWNSGTTDTGNWRLTSPTIVISGETNLALEYNQFFDYYSATYPHSIYVETNVDGAGWVTQSSNLNIGADIGPNAPNLDLSAISGNNLQIRFRMNGNPFGFNYWYLDNILLTADGIPTAPQITWAPVVGLFTDSSLTTPYILNDYAGTVYANPNSTLTYTATEDSSACTDTIIVDRNDNIWLGNTSDWNTATNWSLGTIPTDSERVIIPNITAIQSPLILGGAPIPPAVSRAGCLTIEYDGFIEIGNGGRLIVTNSITVEEDPSPAITDGKLLIRSGGNLVQITGGAINTNNNSGDIKMQRSVTGVASDSYVYWSSPVEGFDVQNVSPLSSNIFEWDPTTSVAVPYGNWINPVSSTMTQGKGYIIRDILGTTPEGGTITPPATTSEFIGVPRNGELTIPIYRGNHLPADGNYPGAGNTQATPLDDNWNLIGNPYPSSISADAFITENAALITNDTDPSISGTIWLWRHENTTSIINDPFYGDYYYNYNGNQYAAYNLSGPNPSGFNGNIASGQGFFVLMEDIAGPTLSADITFRNSMRYFTISGDNDAYDNNSFLRSATNESTTTNAIERHRIWLDLIKPNNDATSILVGYIENATNAIDRLFDGYDLNKFGTRLYSIIDDKEFSIQGKTLPFDQEDRVPLGIIITENAIHQIAINTVDGLFENESQDIYLEDTYTNTIHDLRISPYSFTSENGTFNDRFILRYTNDTLGINELELGSGLIIVAPQNNYIKVNSERSLIESVIVYDLLGRVLFDKNSINESEFILNNHNFSSGTYIVKATLANGQSKAQKIVLKN
ncbi:CUB domain-containing protein [Psychroserpens jangbogonensis]|uniref:CUB domain-containing protein n=1 Tax=Psychroserpens jangbogonensis TaxID=1484460 RepID=UPI00053DE97B|nr:CUB domain-containing protein [Psychroserpens jangbogonensis]